MADQRAHDNQVPVAGGRTVDAAGFDQLSVIGTGGSATVYRARDIRHQRWVALKVLDGQATDERHRRAFDREIRAMGRVGNHPHIVTVLASGFTPTNHPYLVLPLFERGTFAELIDEHGPFTWAQAIDIGIKLCSAVETVHRAGVVHRDIKPGNVFVGVSPAHPLLGDFGISSLVGSERTKTSTMAVTFGYTAPEVLDDERPTAASDIYSLGMTVYRLVQGLPAYHAETPAAVMRKVLDDAQQPRLSAGVPTGLAEVILATLATDPAERPDSALAVARRLQQVQVEAGVATTEALVADEPPTRAGPRPSVQGADPSTAHRVGMILAAALNESDGEAKLRQPGSNLADPPQPQVHGTPGSHPGPATTVDVEPMAIKPVDAYPVDGDPVDGHPVDADPVDVMAGTDRPSLDLPTTYEPRVARRLRQREQPEPPTSERRVWTIVAVVAVVILLVALYAVVGYRQERWPF
jgi:serine/threonine protein kinase